MCKVRQFHLYACNHWKCLKVTLTGADHSFPVPNCRKYDLLVKHAKTCCAACCEDAGQSRQAGRTRSSARAPVQAAERNLATANANGRRTYSSSSLSAAREPHSTTAAVPSATVTAGHSNPSTQVVDGALVEPKSGKRQYVPPLFVRSAVAQTKQRSRKLLTILKRILAAPTKYKRDVKVKRDTRRQHRADNADDESQTVADDPT